MIALPATLLTFTFLLLFSQSNALIGDQIHTLINHLGDWLITIQLPSLPRILVVIGFVLLAIKIHQQRKFAWLVNSNLFAVFLLFFIVQGLNDRAFVARYNYQQALQTDKQNHRLDIPYLIELGPPAWSSLQLIANNQKHFGYISQRADKYLHSISHGEKQRIANSDWRSWQLRRWSARQSLPDFEPQKKQLSINQRFPEHKISANHLGYSNSPHL